MNIKHAGQNLWKLILKNISVCCPAGYPKRIADIFGSDICQFVELDQDFLFARMYGSIGYNKKKIIYAAAILEKIFDLQMKIVFFQTRPNRKQHAAFSQCSGLAFAYLLLHSKRASTSLRIGSFFGRFSYSDLNAWKTQQTKLSIFWRELEFEYI